MTPLPRPGPTDTLDGPGTELDLLWDQMADVVEATEAVAANALAAATERIFPNLPFEISQATTSWLWKHLATTGTDAGSLWAHVPLGGGYYTVRGHD